MKFSKKFTGFAFSFTLMLLLALSFSFAASKVSITNSIMGSQSGEKKPAVFELSRSDISKAILEYTVDGETYSAAHKKIAKNRAEFSIDCSISGKYSLNLLHLTFKDGSTDSVEISENFSVSPSKSEQSRSAQIVPMSNNSRSSLKSSSKKVVVIDAGHDSKHTGATRAGLHEEILTYKIAIAAYNALKQYNNVEVHLTRSSASCPAPGSDLSGCLLHRANVAKSKGADLFVSMHINSTGASSQTSASGAYVYVSNYSKYSSSSRVLTDHILSHFKSRIGLPTNGAWVNADDGDKGYYDDGRMKDDLSVIRNNVLYGIEPILIEHAFINNPNDRAVLANDAKLTQMGIADAEGIADYLGLNKTKWNITGLNASVSGSKVTLTPSISGNSSGLKYKFVYNKYNYNNEKYDWSDWGVIRQFSTTKNTSWTAPKDGKYKIYLDVQDSKGNTQTYTTTIDVPPSFSYSGVNVSSNISLGNTVTIKPNISGNTSGLKYKFVWSYNNWEKWGVIRQFSTNSSASFKPQYAGKYDFYVDVMSNSGSIFSKGASAKVSYSNLNFTGVSVNSTAYLGNTVTIKPNINTSLAGLKYKFVWSYNNWEKWGVIRQFSTNSSASFKPQYAGKYDFYVDVQTPDGQITTKYGSVNVLKEPDIGYKGVSAPSSAKVGNTITIKPNVEKTSGLKYKYVWSYNNWEKWGVISDFSSSTSAKHLIKYPGKYDFYVDIKTANETIITRNASTSTALTWKPTNISLSSNSVNRNTNVKIKGAAEGQGKLTYKFVWSYNNWEKWGVIHQFSSTNLANYTPALKGTYEIYMDVRDEYGNILTIKTPITVN